MTAVYPLTVDIGNKRSKWVPYELSSPPKLTTAYHKHPWAAARTGGADHEPSFTDTDI